MTPEILKEVLPPLLTDVFFIGAIFAVVILILLVPLRRARRLTKALVGFFLLVIASPLLALSAYGAFDASLLLLHARNGWFIYSSPHRGSHVYLIQGHRIHGACNYSSSQLPPPKPTSGSGYENELAMNPATCQFRVEQGYSP